MTQHDQQEGKREINFHMAFKLFYDVTTLYDTKKNKGYFAFSNQQSATRRKAKPH
jgi:hypothetical protein